MTLLVDHGFTRPTLNNQIRTGTRRGTDWVLAGVALALGLIGAILVWSATRTDLIDSGGNPRSYLYRHLLNVMIGVVLAVLASRLDTRLMRLFGPLMYVAGCLGLVAVLFIGSTINGAHAWIEIGGGLEIQPSEYAKLGLIVGMSVLFAQRARGRSPDAAPRGWDVISALLLGIVPLGLIMLQPDLGSAMVVATAAFGVLLAAGVQARWTIGLLVLGVLGAVVAVKAGVLQHYQLERFSAFTKPNQDVQGAAYNVTQARIAIAHGGIFGTGLFHGPQTSGGYVPEQQTDFIFSAAGEQFGFVGATGIVALYGVLLWRTLRIAATADHAGRLIAVGIACWFGFQTFQNVGMNLGMTPVTGLPLPFISYGGSSMFAGALAIGLLQAIRRGSRR
jgi:rod shape determining protein RodA